MTSQVSGSNYATPLRVVTQPTKPRLLRQWSAEVVEYNLLAAVGQSGAKSPSEKMVKVFAALGAVIFPIWVYGAIAMKRLASHIVNTRTGP
jgi:hypothetical protein